MKINYQFADGTKNEVEVDESIGRILLEMDHDNHNRNRRETRRHTSLESFTYEDARYFSDGSDLLADLIASEAVGQAMSHLTERQQYLIRKTFLEGWKYTELAALEGVDESAIRHAVDRAKKKLGKIMK